MKDVNIGVHSWHCEVLIDFFSSTAADECAAAAHDWNIDLTFFEVDGSGSATREGEATFLFILQRSCV